ncbi:hypothetical protein [Jiella sp. M17.18]|uniref:hypothetical protein n=1 Tax=Jiella sp. M17.18 TaxID=3234247 RepID=UPI0034DFCF84
MSSSDRARSRTPRAAFAAVVAAAILPGCTAGPMYGDHGLTNPATTALAPGQTVAGLKGRIAINQANTRSDQIVRNALLFRLNGGAKVAEPLYQLNLSADGSEQGIAIEEGGVATSAIYTMRATYQLVRLSDHRTIATGTRIATIPFDRTNQLYASERALLNARQQAGEQLAAQVELAVVTALKGAPA